MQVVAKELEIVIVESKEAMVLNPAQVVVFEPIRMQQDVSIKVRIATVEI